MEWQPVGTIATSSNYVFTPVIAGTLFKLKHISQSSTKSNLKIAIRQAFKDNGSLAFFDYKLINCKAEQDIILFSLPKGLNNRKLAFKRVDNYLSENWLIEIESLEILEDGISLPITISDVTDLQQRLNSIQDELFLKAFDLDLDTHTANTNNPHAVTALQVGADPTGSAIASVVAHESTTNHPVATTSSKGMFSGEDKSKLNSVQNFATLNSSDTYLLDRSKHLGEQPISTITNLLNTLSTFVKLTTSQIISGVKSFNDLVYLSQHLISNSYISAKSYYLGNSPLNLEVLRTLVPTNSFCADIGFFDIPNGGVSFRLSLIISDDSFSVAKIYTAISIYTNNNTGWLKLVPIREAVYFNFNNCEVDIRLAQSRTYLRVRRTGGNGSSGTAIVRLEFTGSSNTYFEETFTTTVDPNVTGSY